jgi:hypothetical protein
MTKTDGTTLFPVFESPRVHSPPLCACRHCGESRNPELTWMLDRVRHDVQYPVACRSGAEIPLIRGGGVVHSWSFEFVSRFGFRYSDLLALESPH